MVDESLYTVGLHIWIGTNAKCHVTSVMREKQHNVWIADPI